MQFWLFRVSVLASEQGSLFANALDSATRYGLLERALLNPQPAVYRSQVYRLFNVAQVGDAIVGRMSHPDRIDRTVPDASGRRLEDFEEDSEAWVHFLFTGKGEQVIAVQRRQDFFAGTSEGLAEIIQKLIVSSIADPSVEVQVKGLSDERTFWGAIESAKFLYSVDFVFVAPNMFGGRKPLADLLALESKMHNATLMKAGVENPNGLLRFERTPENDAEVDYATSGGGSWIIRKIDKNGQEKEVRSDGEGAVQFSIDDDEETRQTIGHKIREIVAIIRSIIL